MIISDRYSFAFIHIPKNAGTSIRNQLAPLDDRCGYYSSLKIDKNNVMRDYFHLTIRNLLWLDPDEIERLYTYNTCAIVRDPIARFESAIAEYTKQTLRKDFALTTKTEKIDIIRNITTLLQQFEPDDLPYWLIWFTPQCHYIEYEGRFLTSHLFPLQTIFKFSVFVRNITDLEIDICRKVNSRMEFKREYIRRIVGTGTKLKRIMPPRFYASLREKVRTKLLKTQHKSISLIGVIDTDTVDFIQSYYSRDFEIINQLKEQ